MGTAKNSCKTAAVIGLLSRRTDAVNPALGAVSNSDTAGREQIEYIDIGLIDGDPHNFYELSGIDELAANIELLGLQQPLRVRPAEAEGRYVIVSGHRRRAAVAKLVEDGNKDLRDIQCIVERNQESAAMQELRLIFANSDTRKMSSADISRQAQRVETLLYQLKEEGYEFPGRMRDHVAEACKISKSQLARLDVIRKNLEKSWQAGYEKGKLAESTAYALARMPQERQRAIFDGLKKDGQYPNSVYEDTISKYGEKLAAVEKIQCKSYGNGPCVNVDAMRQRIMGQSCWHYNDCKQCCDKCAELAKCKYACPMLADRVKQLKADAKAQKQQEKLAAEEKARPQVEQIKALCKRFGEARAASGKTVEECFQTLGRYFGPDDAAKTEELERLEGEFSADTRLPYGYSCYLSEPQKYVKLADLLGVSLDYLLCRTDNPAGMAPQPEGQLVLSGWMPGGTLPFQSCDVVADFGLAATGSAKRMICRFDGKCFRLPSSGKTVGIEPVRWMALPPVPESDTGEWPV